MSFNDELKKLQLTLRAYVRYQTGTGSENPGVSGDFTDRRYGAVADNTGDIPIRPGVSKFGTFSRALTNLDQGFETPNISTTFTDATGEWRVLAARPWKLLNRFISYVLRVRTDVGSHLDSEIVLGQVTNIGFSPPDKMDLRVEILPGDYFGKSVPRRTLTKDDWPDADPSALGRPVPIVYGKHDASQNLIQNFTGTPDIPAAVEHFVGTGEGGVSGGLPQDGGIARPTNMGCFHREGDGNITEYRWLFVTAIVNGKEGPRSDIGDIHGDQDPTIAGHISFKGIEGPVDYYRIYMTNGASGPDNGDVFDPARPDVNWINGVAGDDGPLVIIYKDVPATSNYGGWPPYAPPEDPEFQPDHEAIFHNDTDGTSWTGSGTGEGYVYSVSAILPTYGGLTNVLTAAAVAQAGALSWDAHPDAIGYRVFRAWNDTFRQFEMQDLGVGVTTFVDDGSGWTTDWRHNVEYYISAKYSGSDEETAMTGPVAFTWCPNNGNYAVALAWSAVSGASRYVIRRRGSWYHFGWGWNRQWEVNATLTSMVDPATDETPVTLPNDSEKRVVRGAMEALYVDTNPTGRKADNPFGDGTAFWGWKYLVAGHGCKAIRDVFVEKSQVTETGGPRGSIDRPTGVTITASGGSGVYRYVVTALNGNGETIASMVIATREADASVDLSWSGVSGASGYRVYRADGDNADFNFVSEVTSTSYSDSLGGADADRHPPERNTTGDAYKSAQETTPPIPIRMREGVDFDVAVEDRNGNRYQVIRFRTSQEGNPVTVNVWGIEDAGTATGSGDGGTLIESGILQFRHFLLNWVFNSATGCLRPGTSDIWYTDTGYQAGMLDLDSFEEADAVAQARVPGGYIGAGFLNAQTDVRNAIWDWLVSFDLDWYFWNGKFKVSLFTPTIVGDRSALSQYTMTDGIFRESFSSDLDVAHHANTISYALGPQVDGFAISAKIKDDESIRNYGRAIESDQVVLRWTRDYVTGSDVMDRRLRLIKDPPILASFAVPLKALADELSSLIAVTHNKGIAPVTTGWNRRACKIERSDIDFDRGIVELQVRDVDYLLAVLGYVYYGDRLWAASDRSYPTAAGDKQDTYAYFADRTTGRLSNGDIAKKFQSRG